VFVNILRLYPARETLLDWFYIDKIIDNHTIIILKKIIILILGEYLKILQLLYLNILIY